MKILRETHFARRLVFGSAAVPRHSANCGFVFESNPRRRPRRRDGFTLVETLVSLLIIGLVFSGTLLGYTRATERAEWAGYSLAAQSLCARQMEQFRAALWDTHTTPITDDTLNIPTNVVYVLDIPVSGGRPAYATNQAFVTLVTKPGPSYYKVITINTSWAWKNRVFTNTLVTIRCPDQ